MGKIKDLGESIGAGVGCLASAAGAVITSPIWIPFYVYLNSGVPKQVRFPNQVKVPRKIRKIKGADHFDRIEVRFEDGCYNINHRKVIGKGKTLAKTVVSEGSEDVMDYSCRPRVVWRNYVTAKFSEKNKPFSWKGFVRVGYFGDQPKEADKYAHITALNIAYQIGNHSQLEVDDRSDQDKENLEKKL